MVKQDIVEKMATELDVPKAKMERAIDAAIESIIDAMKKGDKVNISGFGIFTAKHKEARTARNPKTGESVQVPAKTAAKFRPAKNLKEVLNQ
jgi:DNA-binding protein HU-beta